MKQNIQKYLDLLREDNLETKERLKIEKLLVSFSKRFLMNNQALQLFSHFNEAQAVPQEFYVEKDLNSLNISLYTSSAIQKKISYDEKYLDFLIKLVCNDPTHEKHVNNALLSDLKAMFLTVSLNYKKDLTPYFSCEIFQQNFELMLYTSLSTILAKMGFIGFLENDYKTLKKYNSVLGTFIEANWDYLYELIIQNQANACSVCKDIALEMETNLTLMVWATMLEEYPSFHGKEGLLTTIMQMIKPQIPYLYQLGCANEAEEVEDFITTIVERYKSSDIKTLILQ